MTQRAPKSMTGYAQASVEHNGWALRVHLRSVNHRFLDVRLRLPEGFEEFEPRIRQLLRDRLRRGHVDLALHFEPASSAAIHLNREVAVAYLQAAEDLRQQFGMKTEPDLIALMRLPGVIAASGMSSEEDRAGLEQHLLSCLEQALARLDEMRQAEGRHLAEEIQQRLASILAHVDHVESLAEKVRPAYAARLSARLKDLLGESPLDAARVAQEAAILAERADVSEEVQRLRSHVQQVRQLIGSSGEIGKKLDFLLQEMQREANTLLSKTPGVEAEGLSIAGLAVEVKSEIEKLREQAQNVE
jgi:uncharacterized protein (TIGR00255 family)